MADDAERQRKVVALIIMCVRFGKDPTKPPKPSDKIDANLSNNIAKTLELAMLNATANEYFRHYPALLVTWDADAHFNLALLQPGMTYGQYLWNVVYPQVAIRAQPPAFAAAAAGDDSLPAFPDADEVSLVQERGRELRARRITEELQ